MFTAGLAALAAVLAGCVPISIYPFYGVGDLVQDASLVGVWQSADGQNSWIFTPGRDKSCNLEIQSEGQEGCARPKGGCHQMDRRTFTGTEPLNL